ncbi:MAG: FlgD immunoglobulin-like domain containing protein, partial [Elusimicrobiota bacterium]
TTFSAEAHIWLSTDTASGGIGAFAIRRTQGFRYRAYYGFIQTSSFIPGIYSALTTTPDLQAVSPGIGMNNDAGFTLTMTGEIISTGTLTAVLTKADQTNITATSILRNSDLSATAVFNLLGADLGQWNVILTNHDAQSSTLTDALNIDFPAGDVDITDNLFNPRRGQQARIDVDIHHPGDLSLSIYTINGEPVARIFNQPASIGRTSVLWPGTTESGNVVASGLYYLRTKGPKLDQIDKIIVVK